MAEVTYSVHEIFQIHRKLSSSSVCESIEISAIEIYWIGENA